MTLTEEKKLRTNLERDIQSLVEAFEERTALEVANLDLTRLPTIGKRSSFIVTVTVELGR